jgi:aspartate carbamoyltransferase catalytic subunit
MSAEEITAILDTAKAFREVSRRPRKKVPALLGKVVVNLFFEASTRTRTSFGLAARRVSADVIDIAKATSSVEKGETLIDTARNLEAMGIDIVVIRHSAPGAPHMLAKVLDASVVNAGDGAHEHPTQALLDIYTIREHKGRVEGLTVAIVGDISHSRVARSNIWGLTKLGARVIVVGPSTLIPRHISRMGVEPCYHLDDVLPDADVINLLRVQTERLENSPFPSVREYARLFGMNAARMAKAKKDVLIMAPGPINRGVEITPEVADGSHSVILEQVANGLAVRMAVLYLVSGKQPDALRVT